jgi:uncharacterized ion transporter superfamily protein YfcC
MIVGVVVLGWWMAELSALFLFATIIVGIVSMKNEPRFVHHFLAGAADMVWSLAYIPRACDVFFTIP